LKLGKIFKKPALERSVEQTLKKVKVETYLEAKIDRISSPLPSNIEILDRYQAGYNKATTVTLYQDLDTDVYVYHIEEPPISPTVENLYQLVRERFQSMDIEVPEKMAERELVYEKYIHEALKELGYEDAYTKYPELRYYLIRDLVGWRIIDVMMRDPRVEEIDYSSPHGVLSVVVKHDKIAASWVDTNIALSEEELTKLIEFVAFKTGKQVSVAQPILEARTPEGYRVAANLKEVGMSPAFTIRKFPEMPLSLTVLLKNRTMSPLIAAYLWTLVENMRFVLVIGGMATGKSVGKDSHLLVWKGGKVQSRTFEKLWNELSRTHNIKKAGEMEVIEEPGIKVLTITKEKVDWRPVKYVIRHRHRGKMCRIHTKTGRVIEVTPDHSLLIWRVSNENDGFNITLATAKPTELTEKETYLPYLRTVELKEQVTSSSDGILEKPEIGYLIGFLVAKASQGGYLLDQAKGEILDRIIEALTNNGISYTARPLSRKPHIMRVYIKNPFREMILNLNLGRRAREKRVPDVFWGMDEEWRSAFLAGVIDGDGNIDTNRYHIEITTASHELAYGLLYAFANIGIHAHLRGKQVKKYPGRAYYRVYVPIGINRDGLPKIMKYLSSMKRKLIEEAMNKSSNHYSETETMENPSFLRVGGKLNEILPHGVGFDRVEKIEEVEYDDYVYDVEVPDTQNFEANGIFVHNTTILQAITSVIPRDRKVVTIEDTPELRLAHPRWQALYTRRSVYGTEQDVTMFDLARYSLRTRGQYIIIGEVRDREIQTLVQMAASVSRDTPVLVRTNDEVKLVKIGDVIDRIYREAGNPPDWTKVVPKQGIEVLTLTKDGRVEFKPVQWVLRHRTDKIYRIKYVGGEVKATGTHSVFVLDEETLDVKVKRVDELKPGDMLISFVRRVPQEGDVVAEAFKRMFVGNTKGVSGELWKPEQTSVSTNQKRKAKTYGTVNEWLSYEIAWLARICGYSSSVWSVNGEGKNTGRTSWRVKVKDPNERRANNSSGRFVPLKALRKLVELLNPAVRRDGKHITKYFYDRSKRFVRVETAEKMLDYILKNRRSEVTDEARKLIEGVKWLINSDAEITVVKSVEEMPYNDYVYDFSVPDTEAFYGGTIPVLLHNSGHGSLCLHPDEFVRVKIDDGVVDMPIGVLVEKMLKGELRSVEVLSINLESKRQEWKEITRVYVVPTKSWVVIITSSGVSIKATPDHRFPLTSGSIVRAEELRVGDELMRLTPNGVEPDKVVSVRRVELKSPEWSYDIEVDDNHTFLVNGSIFSMNCTFHAEDPETLFLRMTSPPLNVQPSFLLTIAAVVLQQRLWSRKYRTFVRRTSRIWEITGLKPATREGEIPVTYKEVFTWDPADDYHYPDNVEDLVDTSKQLQIIAKSNYGEDEWRDAMIWELTEKKNFIEQLVAEGVFDFREVTERIYRKVLELRRMR